MSPLEYWRVLAIKAAAAGPYQIIDRCHFCGAHEALASFQPSAFAARVACCRRCREARTGVPDDRGLIRGRAEVSRPLEALTPVRIAGLLPATCGETRPLIDGDPEAPAPQGILYGSELVDFVFAPLSTAELLESYGEAGPDAELLALSDLDQQLDAMLAELDQRNGEALVGLSGSNNSATSSETPALTLDTMADLKAKYGRQQLRIVVGCPLFPPDRAFEWGRRGVMFLGSEVLEALTRDADLAGRGPQVHPYTFLGVRLEPWGSVDDHQTLAVELARELDPS